MSEHRRFFPHRQEIERGFQPLDSEFHDVLVIPPKRKSEDGKPEDVIPPGQFYRFAVVKKDRPAPEADAQAKGEKPPSRVGTYEAAPELWGPADMAQRRIAAIASPEGEEARLGPAFAVLPIKPEPGSSSCGWCYLVNAKNILSTNAWTAEEWSAPGAEDLPAAKQANATELEVLLAMPRGIVLRFLAKDLDKLTEPKKVTGNEETPWDVAKVQANGVTYEVEPVLLKDESDIWSQLRNGSIAGRARYYQGGRRIVPLVNVTSLMDSESDGKAKS